MAWTAAQIDALEKAIATGTLQVDYQDRSVRYHSLEEQLKLLALMKGEVEAATTSRFSRASFSRD